MSVKKQVQGVDGREWLVTMTILWTDTTEKFEHEKEGGRNAVIGMIIVLGFLWFALVAWAVEMYPVVQVPWWMILLLLGLVLFFPGRWVIRRPRRLLVEGGRWPDDDEDDAMGEAWSGYIRGRTEARAEFNQAIKTLKRRGTPARANSPLQPQ
ncbi:hypothetical protein [Actinomycetospora atypica]|uniref:DUF983 domain-containing protein n=1 Tax=Actinomycetospora atypica TaxID=1290095 RepID=A0ABV9YML7_9PSEU